MQLGTVAPTQSIALNSQYMGGQVLESLRHMVRFTLVKDDRKTGRENVKTSSVVCHSSFVDDVEKV